MGKSIQAEERAAAAALTWVPVLLRESLTSETEVSGSEEEQQERRWGK